MAGDISWRLEATRATLVCGPFSTSLDALAPAFGLGSAVYENVPLVGSHFLGVGIDVGDRAELIDFYQRGSDVIARYVQTADRIFAVVAYWRAGWSKIADETFPHVDLIVSVETNLLDSSPSLEARSFYACPPASVVRRPPGCSLARLAWPTSYLELCHPADAIASSIEAVDDGTACTTLLFGLPLEKGVILRSRLRGLFASHDLDERFAATALAQFADEAPPLTT
ncbi:MAG TPA: hypothetical protein VHC22_14405 [Pirellulales bacterium]|nr:hypothetical protein [Pirellulales bacterium]